MRTTSGAHVFTYGDYCNKVGRPGKIGRRVSEQAEYCQLLGDSVCPQVVATWPNGYVMERLNEMPLPAQPGMYVNQALHILQTKVWSRPALYTLNWQRHFDYVLHRVDEHAPALTLRAVELIDCLNTDAATHCLIHGDPTAENMMHGRARSFLADPLPPTPYIPECREVDLGKMMQSLLGYEDVKTNGMFWARKWAPAGRVLLLDQQFEQTHSQYLLTLWFCFAHCARLLPYQPKDQRWKYLALTERALDLAEDECS